MYDGPRLNYQCPILPEILVDLQASPAGEIRLKIPQLSVQQMSGIVARRTSRGSRIILQAVRAECRNPVEILCLIGVERK